MISSYPKVYNLGHPALELLFSGPVIVEEKIDGSQFSFSLCPEGTVHFRSHGAEIDVDAPPKLFRGAVDAVKFRLSLLRRDWIYRAECLTKPKHNVLCYDRMPRDGLIIFDIEDERRRFLSPESKSQAASELGLECVPVLFWGHVPGAEELKKLLVTRSVLGGSEIEGVVVKPAAYDLYGRDGKILMGKFVSERFKEIHRREWKEGDHAPVGSKITRLLGSYRTEARWEKAIQHLRDEGKLLHEPKDIGGLMIELQKDVADECGEEIRHELWKLFKHDLMRTVTRGFPEWYKLRLLSEQKFSGVEVDNGGKSG